MELFEEALQVSRKRLRPSSVAVYRSMWHGYSSRLRSIRAPGGSAEPGNESALQMLNAIEAMGSYSAQKRVFSLVRWVYNTIQSKTDRAITNPCEEIRRQFIPDRRPVREPLEESWQEKMVRAAREACRGWKAVRLTTIVKLLTDTALRNTELRELRLSDVVGSPPTSIRAGRQTSCRTLELTETASRQLQEWLAVRPTCDSDYLFIADETGRQMDSSTLWRQLKRVTVAAEGYAPIRRYGTGLIRATKAKEMQRCGYPLSDIAGFLGHVQPASTGELLERVLS